jgi:hypothetical protein
MFVTSSRNMPAQGATVQQTEGAIQAGLNQLPEVLLVGQVTAG